MDKDKQYLIGVDLASGEDHVGYYNTNEGRAVSKEEYEKHMYEVILTPKETLTSKILEEIKEKINSGCGIGIKLDEAHKVLLEELNNLPNLNNVRTGTRFIAIPPSNSHMFNVNGGLEPLYEKEYVRRVSDEVVAKLYKTDN